MRDKMERFSAFPFSVGCRSESSVAIVRSQPKNPTTLTKGRIQSNGRSTKSSQRPHRLLAKPNISAGVQKVIKSFKSLSYFFQFYKEDGNDDEVEMEIGLPTDVQHVAHIGWEGFNSTGSTTMKSWEKGAELLSLPSISLMQFELAMASQAGGPLPHGPH